MFEKRYMTRGVSEEIPLFLQRIMWSMIDNMEVEKKDYLQVFKFEKLRKGEFALQKITHTQEEPDYINEITIPIQENEIVNTKIFVIDDVEYCTMLLAEEY